MTREEIIKKFQNLNLWKSKGQRAVHKPLLVLYAIGKLLRGENRLISYADAEDDLQNLLKEFGPLKINSPTSVPILAVAKRKRQNLGNT